MSSLPQTDQLAQTTKMDQAIIDCPPLVAIHLMAEFADKIMLEIEPGNPKIHIDFLGGKVVMLALKSPAIREPICHVRHHSDR